MRLAASATPRMDTTLPGVLSRRSIPTLMIAETTMSRLAPATLARSGTRRMRSTIWRDGGVMPQE